MRRMGIAAALVALLVGGLVATATGTRDRGHGREGGARRGEPREPGGLHVHARRVGSCTWSGTRGGCASATCRPASITVSTG